MGNQNPGIHIPPIGACDPQVRQALQDIVRRLGVTSSPIFETTTLLGLTASRIVATDSDNLLESTDLDSWVTGTANQITVTGDSDGTVTLSTPQDIHIDATPEWAGETIKDSDDNIVMFVDADEFYITSGNISRGR